MTKIALTAGEPAGIGPDIIVLLAAQQQLTDITIVADKNLLVARAAELNLALDLNKLSILHVPLEAACSAGKLNPANASYVLKCLELATQACLNKQYSALVTAPVHKGIINDAGIAFSGHTEFLAKLSHTPRCVMLLTNQKLRVALVTTHLALRSVPDAITRENLIECIQILQHDLIHKFKIRRPRIAVCALNPHAGENGYLGREEIDIIIPTLDELRAKGFNLTGPLAADTAFTKKYLENSDVILTMYHDQGLPVIKSQAFGKTVNVSLGLAFIRTSVDHGTALDLAGTGKADASSLLAAIEMARNLS